MRFICISSCLLAFLLIFSAGAYEAAAQETATDDTTGYDVSEVDWTARTYVGRRDTIGFDAVEGYFSTHLPSIYGTVQSKGMTVSGPASGLYWFWDTENMQADLAAVVPVDQAPEEFADYEVFRIPAGKALVVDYHGPYEQTMAAHDALGRYMEEHATGEPSVVVEEYITDPETEPDPAKWHTRIIYVFQE